MGLEHVYGGAEMVVGGRLSESLLVGDSGNRDPGNLYQFIHPTLYTHRYVIQLRRNLLRVV